MAEKAPTTPGVAPAKNSEIVPPSVEEIKPKGRRLPERYFRVVDHHRPKMMTDKGISEPLVRKRGISKTNADRAGIETPPEE